MASNYPEAVTVGVHDSFLLCGICTDRYKKPQILQCLHTFCKVCLLKLSESNNRVIKCPVCRRCQDISGDNASELMKNDTFLEGLLEVKDSTVQGTQKCDACNSGNVVKFCTDCNLALCENCVRAHAKIPVTRFHCIISPEDYERLKVSDPVSVQAPVYCSLHPGIKVKLYCETCESAVCSECAVFGHSEHKCKYVKNAASEIQYALELYIIFFKGSENEVKVSQANIIETLQTLETIYKAECQKLREHINQVVCQVQQAGDKLLKEMKEIYNEHKTELNAQYKELDIAENDIKTVREYTQNCMMHGAPIQVMSAFKDLNRQIKLTFLSCYQLTYD
ncbi:E3 ubiquitin-protein ligase TRIM33-like [Glandiceps talaboti]